MVDFERGDDMAQFFKNDTDYIKATSITKLEDDAYVLSGDIMKANLQFAEIEYQLLTLKDKLSETQAKYYIDIRTQKENAGIKITEATIDALISSQPTILKLKAEIAEATAGLSKLKGLKDALSAKSVMLATIIGREN
jgi:phosphopantetheine adenylyltransferase